MNTGINLIQHETWSFKYAVFQQREYRAGGKNWGGEKEPIPEDPEPAPGGQNVGKRLVRKLPKSSDEMNVSALRRCAG